VQPLAVRGGSGCGTCKKGSTLTLHGAESVHKQRTGFKSMLKLVGMAEPSNARQKQESSQGRSI